MAIDTSNISFINYLWTKKNSDGTITGIRLSKDNLPEYLANPIPILAGKNISITPTNAGIEISAAADGKVKTVNHISPDVNGNVTVPIPTAGTTAKAVSTTASGGSATTWSKSDHVHNISLATGDNNGQVKIAGTNVSVKGLGSAAYTASTAYATSGHTHSFNQITSRGEAFLDWGGKNFSGSYGPIDAAMVPELGANRLAFMPANAVTIEYSRDGGSTWTNYGPTDSQKINLFNGLGSSFTIGKATSGAGNIATNKYQLRVNIYTSAGSVYTVLNKFVIYLSTSGTNNNWCTIRARKQSDYTAGNDTWTTFANKISVSGWSGYNVINTSGITTYGNTASTQYGHIQFIFGCDTGSTNNSYAGLNISKIFGFGGVGWTTPSTMAKTGRMYTYDSSQNVTFPAAITSGAINSYNVVPRTNNTYNLGSSSYKWANVYATTIYENGTSLANKYLGKTAKAADADKLDGNDSTYYLNYNNLTNKPTIPAAANNGTITIKQTGISDQTFTVNQSGNKTITLVNTWRPLGTGASDACAGNDPRLSNARTPTAHTHTSNDVTDALTLIQGNNITLTPTASGLEISAAADGKVKTVNNQQPDSNGNVQLTLDHINDGSTRKLANYVPKSLTSTKGDMIYASAANTPARLGIGSNGQFLSIANGIPKWVNNPNSDTHYVNYLQIKGNGTEAVKFTQNADKSLNLKPGNNVSISAASGEITISATVPTKSSWNYDDTYVKYSATQSLTDAQKTQARTNIGAGTSSFTGYTSSNKLHTDYINNAAGWTSNKGTVTSVRVQAGTGLSSSQNTAQTSTLNTTISIANGYKLPTTTEWAEKPSINDAYSISAGSGIVLTPTASSLEISAKVKTVNNQQPDSNGNVQLTAANIGALPIDNAVDSLNINKELACGSNGKICVGKFGVYDSNITLNVSSTTSNTYSGTIVIATQNGIICNAKVYGDATKALSNILYIAQESYSSNRGVVGVYLNLAGWSKNKIDIRCLKLDKTILNTYYTNLMTSITAMPTYSEGAPNTATSAPKKYTGTTNDIFGAIPTSLKNPKALTFGSKTYDGSSAQTITASDLGALTSHQDISGKQDKLISGTNIKTINGNSILGSGDLTISGGGGSISVATYSTLGGIKPWCSTTGASTYNGTNSYATSPAINSATTTSGRFYPICTDKNGRAYVNVPWTNTTYSNVATMAGSTGDGSSASYAYSTLTNHSSTSHKLKIFCRRITDAFNSTTSKHISFTGVSFDQVPYVTIGVYGTNSYTLNNVNVFNVTKTGCDYRATSNNGAAGSAFYIIAIQPY